MPKVTTVHNNFTSGELTPKMWGRVDVQRYQSGAEEIVNGWPVVHGGVDKRWGTLFHAATKYADKKARLIPFVYSRSQAYMLEFGHNYMRVHNDDGVILSAPATPFEIATPYTETMLASMDYTQAADTLLQWVDSVYPRRLRRFADDNWVMDFAPFNPTPFGETGYQPAQTVTLSAATVGTGRTFSTTVDVFMASDVGRDIWAGLAGVATITAFTDAKHVTCSITSAFDATSYTSGNWTITGSPQTKCTPSIAGPIGDTVTLTLDADGWRSTDVGKFVIINEGLVKITTVTDALNASAKIMAVLNTAVAAVANAWTLNDSVWNDRDGYPATGTFHSQRLLAAGSPAYPQTVWGSGIADYFGFQLGGNDDEAFAFDLVSDDLSPITYLSSMESLVALTYAGEFTMDGGVEKPITPTNIRAKPRSNNGCHQVRPIRIGDEELYVERGGTAIRAVAYDPDTGKWACPDVSVLAEHIMEPGIVDMTWHKKPGTLVFAARTDGILASCTYDRDQDVIGWARQDVGGVVESVATIPSGTGDRTWMIVRREIDGNTVRYIEKFDASTYVDCAVNGTNPSGSKVWTNLDHLEGETVRVLADGVPQPDLVVTGGQIELPRKAKTVQIGKAITMRLKLLPPEVNGSGGAAQGSACSTSAVWVRVLNTIGLTVNGQTVAFRQFGEDVLDKPVDPFTGIKQIDILGWDQGDSPLTIEHSDPLPCHLLSVIRKLTFNEG